MVFIGGKLNLTHDDLLLHVSLLFLWLEHAQLDRGYSHLFDTQALKIPTNFKAQKIPTLFD